MNGAQVKIGSAILDCEAMELKCDGRKVPLGARACRVLGELATRPGEIVSPSELMAIAWPGITVEDVNLRVQIAAIRKALVADCFRGTAIKTVPREGYVLVAPKGPLTAEPPATAPPAIPRLLTPLVGRNKELAQIVSLLPRCRIVTITGAAGIGKTSLALAVAAEWARGGADAAFVDLAVPMRSAQVAGKIFTALEIEGQPQDMVAGIVRSLQSRPLLLVIDNCEHVLDGVSEIAQAIAGGTDGVTILATSREALETAGEYVVPLGPLECGPIGGRLSADAARSLPAIELFAGSAKARGQAFPVHDGNATQVAEICRRLDGIPLAIKLAAASCSVMTVGELARGLDDRFALLTHGERNALPRHRTLQAALDWGYELLSDEEARVFRALGVFRNAFSLADAQEVAGNAATEQAGFSSVMSSLVSKSLVSCNLETDPAAFRLLETSRIYALLKLNEHGESRQVAQAHARGTLRRLGGAQAGARAEGVANFGRLVDDWRGAHDHAVESGQRALALSLLRQAIAVSELYMGPEFVSRADATFALARKRRSKQEDLNELAVRIFYAITISQGITIDQASMYARVTDCSQKAIDLAKAYKLPVEHLSALWTLIYSATGRAEMGELRKATDEFSNTALLVGDPLAMLSAERLKGVAAYWSGHFTNAIISTSRALDGFPSADASPMIHGFAHLPSALSMRARANWALGNFADAKAEVELADEVADKIGHAPTKRWLYLVARIPIAIWCGDLKEAWRLLATIEQLGVETSNPGWSGDLDFWKQALAALQTTGGSYDSAAIRWRAPTPWQADMQTALHCGFHRTVDMTRINANNDHWCAAEHYRSAGEQLLAEPAGDLRVAEHLLSTALQIAGRQRAVAWQIRARVSLARLCLADRRFGSPSEALRPVTSEFAQDDLNADVRIAWSMA